MSVDSFQCVGTRFVHSSSSMSSRSSRRLEGKRYSRATGVPVTLGCMQDTGCWLLAVGCWLLAVGCWLLAVGCWLLVVGCWLLVVADTIIPGLALKDGNLWANFSVMVSVNYCIPFIHDAASPCECYCTGRAAALTFDRNMCRYGFTTAGRIHATARPCSVASECHQRHWRSSKSRLPSLLYST